MDSGHESVVVILAAGGEPLTCDALNTLDGVAVTWARVEREGAASCLAARVRHADAGPDFRVRVRQWGEARGWALTVAPCAPRR